VDAQASISIPNAQNIVSQLVDIAKANNAMDVIGTSTSWRWQEGLISRMPKTRTVAAILSKAFKTDDPRLWLSHLPKDLQWFVNTNILKFSDFERTTFPEVRDVYEAYFLTSRLSGTTSQDEILFGLCYFKFASSLEESIDFYESPDLNEVMSVYGSWAKKKYDSCFLKFEPTIKEKKDSPSTYNFISSESYTRKKSELMILRNKIVGFNSIHDMWNSISFRVTDEQHIDIEKEMKAFFNSLKDKYIGQGRGDSVPGTRLRTYAVNAISYPSFGEGLL